MTLKELNVQIQPDRSPNFDLSVVLGRLRTLDSEAEVSDGIDDGRYINVRFRADDVARLWFEIRGVIAETADFFDAAIVTCEGDSGWDDYLLLHHFDRSQPLDKISN